MLVRAALIGAFLTALAAPCYAGPCSADIDATQARIDAKLEAEAAAGKTAPESTAATAHHQPTPNSIAAAEARIGDVSGKLVHAVEEDMAQARRDDAAGNEKGCTEALSRVHKALGDY
jgi:hypothetical protein